MMSTALSQRGTVLAAEKRAASKSAPVARTLPRARPVAAPGPIHDSLRVSIPLCPSANSLFANVAGKGRVKTKAYRQWINDAGWIVKGASVGRIVGPYTAKIFVASKMRGDVDGRSKGILDLFVSLGITDDDRHCKSCLVERSNAIPQGECLIVLAVAP